MCVLSIKVPIRKKSGNLSYAPCIYVYFMQKKARSRQYTAQTIMDTEIMGDIALLANTPTQAESPLHSLEKAAHVIGLHVNADKTDYMCFNQKGDVSTLNVGSLKLEDKFTYLRSSVSLIENDINVQLVKAWSAINSLLNIWKSDLSDKIKCNFSKQFLCQFYYMDAPHGR